MKIKSIIRKQHTVLNVVEFPVIFTVGETPVEESPVVKSIVLFDQGAYGENNRGFATFKGYKGPCYLISFVDSPTKRIVPANTVVDLAIDSEPKKKEKEPTEDAQAEAAALPEE